LDVGLIFLRKLGSLWLIGLVFGLRRDARRRRHRCAADPSLPETSGLGEIWFPYIRARGARFQRALRETLGHPPKSHNSESHVLLQDTIPVRCAALGALLTCRVSKVLANVRHNARQALRGFAARAFFRRIGSSRRFSVWWGTGQRWQNRAFQNTPVTTFDTTRQFFLTERITKP
jgi:hypothetical protein